MQIDVTAEDIEQGEPMSPVNCPVARAISRALGKSVVVGVAQWNTRDCSEFNPLPDFVATNISKMLNNNKSVEPFSFDLEIP